VEPLVAEPGRDRTGRLLAAMPSSWTAGAGGPWHTAAAAATSLRWFEPEWEWSPEPERPVPMPEQLKDRLLVVDDEATVRLAIAQYFEDRGYEVAEAASLAEARRQLRDRPDGVVLDYRLPDGDALTLLGEIRAQDPDTAVIVLTGFGSIDLAVKAIKMGAENFLTKPVELSALEVVLARAAENRRVRRRNQAGIASRRLTDQLDPFVGSSAAMRELQREAEIAVRSQAPVLILGPTGAGKGVLARWLHEQGPRRDEALVDLNCAGLSRELVESELFGHARGAFTGAVNDKRGLLEIAHKGTLFLDEIGDLDLAVQPKLLTALEERRFRRLGDVVERRVDIHLISATHQNLPARVESGSFRADLFFRINGLLLEIPGLSDRREDIVPLANSLLGRLSLERGRELRFDADAEAALASYEWPGNVRELRAVLEQAMLRCEGVVLRREHLRFAPLPTAGAAASREPVTLDEMARLQIEKALQAERGRVAEAARRLGIPRSSLYQKIKDHGIDLERFKR
jgi:DNA-binding NtrC family response regulator